MTIFYKSIYNDKTSFMFSSDDAGNGDYAKIDRNKLVTQEIYNDSKLLHKLHLEKGQRLIMRSRIIKKMSAQTFDLIKNETSLEKIPGTMTTIILIGYQETVQGQNRQSITVIFLDDFHTEHISKWKNAPLDAIIPTEEEKLG